MVTQAPAPPPEGSGSPRRILVVTQDFGGGTGRHLGNLIRRWSAAGWRVRVVCQGDADSRMTQGIDITRLAPPPILPGFPVAQFRGLYKVSAIVHDFRPDVLHCFFFWSFMYGRLLRRVGRVPILVENREDQGFNVRPWQYRALRLTAAIPDRVVCVSNAVREVALGREGLRPPRAVVIRNGVEIPPVARARIDARRRLGIPESDLVVGMVANLNRPVKGVKYFVDAMPYILRRHSNARFIIVGDGDLRATLQDRANALEVASRVDFSGYQADVANYYAAFDLSVLTSLSEGLSITLLESMSHGIPVVATSVGGNPELVTDGVTGSLVPPKEPRTFADRVCQLLDDPATRREMGQRARAFVREHFDVETVATRYLDLYRQLLTGSAPRGTSNL